MTRKLKKQLIKKDEAILQVKQEKIEHYSGPIPHPNVIEGYEKNCPGATDRILKMTENELEHRRKIETEEQNNINECRLKAINAEIESVKRAQFLGFILLLIILVCGFILLFMDKKVEGFVSIATAIVTIITSVLWKNKGNNINN